VTRPEHAIEVVEKRATATGLDLLVFMLTRGNQAGRKRRAVSVVPYE
jgi:hypothetical protein